MMTTAGLLLPATLARHLGLREPVDRHLDLGGAPGRADTGDKLLTLVASALAGGATASTTRMRCVPVGRSVFSAAWSRRHPPSGSSYAAFAGATSVNSTA